MTTTKKPKAVPAASDAAPRRRGRPSSINRDKVIDTALALLERNPTHDFTMAEVAKELGIVPMGVYKHVKNKDELLAGIAQKVFAELDLSLDATLDLDARFYQWARQYHDFFLQRPYATGLIIWQSHYLTADFMNWTADLAALLHEYGVPKRKMARTLVWLVRHLNAYRMLVQQNSHDQRTLVEEFDIASLSPERQKILKPLLPQIASFTHEDFYEIHFDATLTMLKHIAQGGDS